MAWDATAKLLEELEEMINPVWPAELAKLDGESQLRLLLDEELRVRPLLDATIRDALQKQRWPKLPPLENWFLHQRVVLARKVTRNYARNNEPLPAVLNPDRLPTLMLVNFWNEMGAEMVRERWKKMDMSQGMAGWDLESQL